MWHHRRSRPQKLLISRTAVSSIEIEDSWIRFWLFFLNVTPTFAMPQGAVAWNGVDQQYLTFSGSKMGVSWATEFIFNIVLSVTPIRVAPRESHPQKLLISKNYLFSLISNFFFFKLQNSFLIMFWLHRYPCGTTGSRNLQKCWSAISFLWVGGKLIFDKYRFLHGKSFVEHHPIVRLRNIFWFQKNIAGGGGEVTRTETVLARENRNSTFLFGFSVSVST